MNVISIFEKITTISKTARGKNILTFLIFLLISTLFWFMMVLNDDVQRDYKVKLEIEDLPDNVTILTKLPENIDVSVIGKGRSFIKFDWGAADPILRVKYSDLADRGDNRMALSEQNLSSAVRDIFGTATQVSSTKPDSLSLKYTTRPGDKLPLFVNLDVQASPEYIIYEKPIVDVDSVYVYSVRGIPSSVISVRTEQMSLRNLSDTTIVDARVIAPAGTRVVPETVSVTIPVQPLVSKSQTVDIKVVNVPRGWSLLTFPSAVQISYLLPMSLYSSDYYSPNAVVDYLDINPSRSSVTVDIQGVPDYYRSVMVNPSSVEYVIDHPQMEKEKE